ncbi:MAG: flagellar basal body-associated FliL family protein [Bacillota bacterium]
MRQSASRGLASRGLDSRHPDHERGAVSVVTLVIVVVVTAAVVGGALFMVLGRKGGEKPVKGETYRVGEFITNLADPGGKKFIKVLVEVEVSGTKPVGELQKKTGAVRDTVLAVLRSRTMADVEGPDGMAALGDELGKAIGGLLTTGKVLKVNFLDFMIQ